MKLSRVPVEYKQVMYSSARLLVLGVIAFVGLIQSGLSNAAGERKVFYARASTWNCIGRFVNVAATTGDTRLAAGGRWVTNGAQQCGYVNISAPYMFNATVVRVDAEETWGQSRAVETLTWECPAGSDYLPSIDACVPTRDVFRVAKPTQNCAPAFGDPIYPLTGTTKQPVNTGFSIGGEPLRLTFDSSRYAPTATAAPSFYPALDASGFGRAWLGSLHRNLYFQSGGSTASANLTRGNGEVVSFTGDASGNFIAESDSRDRLFTIAGGWRFVDAQLRSLETYNSLGQLVRIDRNDGQSLTFIYSVDSTTIPSLAPAPGYLVRVLDTFGRSVEFGYELPAGGIAATDGRVNRITDAAQRIITPSYDGAGNLQQLLWPDTALRQFLYEDALHPWALTGVVDENQQRHVTLGYDGDGRAIRTELAGGVYKYSASYVTPPLVQVTESYDSVANVIWRYHTWQTPISPTVTLPNLATTSLSATAIQGMPRLTSQSQPAGSGCGASSSAQSYDANGNLASRDDFNGNRTCYVSNLSRNLETVRVEGLVGGAACSGVTSAGAALPTGSRKESTEWHPDWMLKSRVAEPGRITTSVYNGQPDPFNGGAVASCAPGSALLPDGKPIAVLCKQVEQATTDADGGQGFAAALQAGVAARVRNWTYNEFGQVLTEKDPLNNTTTYEYYPDTAFTGADPYAEGHTRGDLKQVTNAASQVTQYTKYNKTGLVLEMKDPNDVLTSYSYDLRQRQTSVSVGGQSTQYEYWPTGLLKKVTQPDGVSFVAYGYDDAHRLTVVSDNLGNSITYTLDNAGNRTAEEVRDPSNSLRRQLTRSIDALGRVQQITGRQ